MKAYKTVCQPAVFEFEEKRSRFIGQIFPVDSEESAAEIIADIKKKHHDARHNCSAYILKNGFMKYSDDGEPQGTAGKPILEVISKNGLSDVLIVVTRYFGGILLGAGGLTRAYSHSAAQAVNTAQITEMLPHSICKIDCPYGDYSNIKRLIEQMEAKEKDSEFGGNVTVGLIILSEKAEDFGKKLTEMSASRLTLKITDEILCPDITK